MKKYLSSINLLAVLIFITCLLFGLLTYNYTNISGDLGEYVNNPLRILNGDWPYKDFWLLFPPAEVYLPALLYKIFGLNINIALLVSPITKALIASLAFLVGHKIYKNKLLAIALAVLLFFKGVPHPHFVLMLASTLFFINYLDKKTVKHLILSGLFIAFSFLFRFYLTGAMMAAFFATIIINEILKNKKSFFYAIKQSLYFILGPILIFGLMSIMLFGVWPEMMRAVILESIAHGTSMDIPYFSDLELVKLQSVDYYLTYTYYLLPLIILPFSLMALISKKFTKSDKIIVLLFTLWALFTFPKSLGRSDIPHLTRTLAPIFFLVIFFLQKSYKKISYIPFLILTIILLLQAPLSIKNTIKELKSPHYEVATKYGQIFMSNKSEADTTKEIIKYINTNTKEDDHIFVTSFFTPAFYALTNRKNPTHYDSLIDLISRPSEKTQLQICNDLVKKNTKLIIHTPYWGFDGKKELQFLYTSAILQKCIEANFKEVKKVGGYIIYR